MRIRLLMALGRITWFSWTPRLKSHRNAWLLRPPLASSPRAGADARQVTWSLCSMNCTWWIGRVEAGALVPLLLVPCSIFGGPGLQQREIRVVYLPSEDDLDLAQMWLNNQVCGWLDFELERKASTRAALQVQPSIIVPARPCLKEIGNLSMT